MLLSIGAALCSGPASALALSERLHTTVTSAGERVAEAALSRVGTGYRYGSSTGDEALDCSGLVQQVYREAGLDLPRTAREQASLGLAVRVADLKKGDLVFYRWKPHVLHVAVYLDGGYIVHASPKNGRVVLTRINAQWLRHMVGARRVL
jgi:cell wall-associated NlpC family hydrolase